MLEKGLDFVPIQQYINEPDLCKDFQEFCRRMKIKCNFRNEPSQEFNIVPVFTCKSSWKKPLGYPYMEVFLNQVQRELFKETQDILRFSNLSSEEWRAVRSYKVFL